MKKVFLCFLCVLFSFIFVGCANQTQLRIAHISDLTVGNSTNYAVKVTLDEDDRVEERYVDLQIMSSKGEQFLTVGEENKESMTIFLERKDYWYNMSYLLSDDEVEIYQTYKDYGTKIFNITSKNDVTLKFRVVAGKEKENANTGEKILVLSEDLSDEFSLEVKKNLK